VRTLIPILALILLSAACGKGREDPTGFWTLYVPSDMVRQARSGKEVPPTGTLDVRPNGTFSMRIQAQDRSLEMQGSWKAEGTSFSIEGREREMDLQGRSTEKQVRSRGTLSANGRILRVYGRDFVR
jgi:hypothetical protein